MKTRFRILKSATGYDKQISAALFNAVCCLHNFIAAGGIPIKDRNIQISVEKRNQQVEASTRPRPILSARQRKEKGEALRDQIAGEMWASYQALMRSRRF